MINGSDSDEAHLKAILVRLLSVLIKIDDPDDVLLYVKREEVTGSGDDSEEFESEGPEDFEDSGDEPSKGCC